MKIAFYVEDGLEQIVLTPQSPIEKAMLKKLHDGTRSFEMSRGEFYPCTGGWVTQGNSYGVRATMFSTADDDRLADLSTIIVLKPKEGE